MANMEGKYHLLSFDGEDSQLAKNRRWLKLGFAVLCASSLVLLSTSVVRTSKATSFLEKTNKDMEMGLGATPWELLGNMRSRGTESDVADARKDPATYLLQKKRGQAEAARLEKLEKAKLKKVEVVDPVQQKIAAVCEALQKPEYKVECRDMLLATAPHALGEAKDKRHEWYRNVVGMVGDVFMKEDSRLKERIADKQSLVDGADAQQRTLETQKETLESKLETNQVALDAKRVTQETNETSLKDLEGAMEQATEQALTANATYNSLVEDKERYLHVQRVDLHALKEGIWESAASHNEHMVAIKALLNELPHSKSMLVALPLALYQKPAARDKFENMTLAFLDHTINTQAAKLQVKIQETKKDVAEKEAQVQKASEAVKSAEEQLRVSREMVTNEEAARMTLESELQDVQKAMKDHRSAVKKAGEDLKYENSGLDSFQKVLDQFTELRDRVETPKLDATDPAVKVVSELIQNTLQSPTKSQVRADQMSNPQTQAFWQSPMELQANSTESQSLQTPMEDLAKQALEAPMKMEGSAQQSVDAPMELQGSTNPQGQQSPSSETAMEVEASSNLQNQQSQSLKEAMEVEASPNAQNHKPLRAAQFNGAVPLEQLQEQFSAPVRAPMA